MSEKDTNSLLDVNSLEVQSEILNLKDSLKGTPAYLKAPNGQDSILSEPLWLLTRTQAFKDWHGDWQSGASTSFVLDDNGEPKVLYHGTAYGGFNEFASNQSFYFTENPAYAEPYKNTLDSLRSSEEDETYPEVKAVFIRADQIFDTRIDEVRDLYEKQFYGQLGDDTKLSDRGLLDSAQALDALGFIKENELDYNVIVVDESAGPANNNERGTSYIAQTGLQALILTGEFTPPALANQVVQTEVERQIYEARQRLHDSPDFMRDNNGHKKTALTEKQWLTLRTPLVDTFSPAKPLTGAMPAVKYAHSSLEQSSYEFTHSLSNKPYVQISKSMSEALQGSAAAYPIVTRSGRTLYLSESDLSSLRNPTIDEALGYQVTGYDIGFASAILSSKDATISSYLDYIDNYGAQEGESLWMQTHGADADAAYFDDKHPLYLKRFSDALLAPYGEGTDDALRELGIDDASIEALKNKGYTKPLTIEALTNGGEQTEQIFAVLKQAGIKEISDATGEAFLLDTSNEYARTLDNPEVSFADIAQYHIQQRTQAQTQANSVMVHEARLQALKEQLQDTEGYLKAPNGEPTLLNEHQWLQIQTNEFKTWFGDYTDEAQKDKMLLDKNGEPQIFFHGTPDIRPIVETGQIFNPNPLNIASSQAWFTPDIEVAQSYAAEKLASQVTQAQEGVLPNYLKFNNPLIVEGRGRLWRDAQYNDAGEHILDVARARDANGNAYDGVIIKNVYDNFNSTNPDAAAPIGKMTTTYAVFDKSNVKSASLNSGAFSLDDTDIRFSIADNTELDNRYLKLAAAYVDGDLSVESDLHAMVHQHALDSGYTDNYDYRMRHEAPHADEDGYHSSLEDVSDMYGSDIYTSNALSYFRTGFPKADVKAINIIQQNRDNEDAMIKIYRAVPKDAPDVIYNRDWVAITKEYAEIHGEAVLKGNYKIIENTVPAKHLYTEGNSIQEWGYDNGQTMYRAEIGNTQKLAALVTFDDEGEIIPLSARFKSDDDDVRYSFAGVNAKSANKTAHKLAIDMLNQGVMPAQVQKQTGWLAGVDGKMRFLIDDKKSKIKKMSTDSTAMEGGALRFHLSDILEHEDLFKAYPELKSLQVSAHLPNSAKALEDTSFGHAAFEAIKVGGVTAKNLSLSVEKFTQIYSPTEDERKTLRSVLMHEIQHAIQDIEGFAPGDSPKDKAALSAKEFYKKTGVFDYLDKKEADFLKATPEDFQVVAAQRDSEHQKLVEKYGDDNGVVDYDKVPDAESDRFFGLIDELYDKYPDLNEQLEDIRAQKLYYLASDRFVLANEQYLASAGEVEARKVQAMLDDDDTALSSIKQAYPDYLQVVSVDNSLAATMAFSPNASAYGFAQQERVDEVEAQLRDYLGDKTFNNLKQQGKLEVIAQYKVDGVEGFYEKGKATLVAANLNKNTVIPTLLHELGGHAGFQQLLKPKQYQRLMGQFDDLVENKDEDALKARQLADRDVKNKQDEYLPYYLTVAANKQSLSLTKNTVSAVKAWAFEKLGAPIKLNANDMIALSKRMIKKAADPKVRLAKEGVKLESKRPISTARIMRKPKAVDRQNNAIGQAKPATTPAEFIPARQDILTINKKEADAFERGVEPLLKQEDRSTLNEQERYLLNTASYDFKPPAALVALDGYLHVDTIFKPHGGRVLCSFPENKDIKLSKWVCDKIQGQVGEYQNDDHHASTKETIKAIYKAISNPVAILRSNSSDALAVLTTHETQGNPLLVIIKPNQEHKGDEYHYVSSAFGRGNPQAWIENQAKIGRLLYFNPEQKALGIDNHKVLKVIDRLGDEFKPLDPNGLRLRYYDAELNKMNESLEDALTRENAIHEVFKKALKEHIVMTDEDIEKSFYAPVLPSGSKAMVQTDLLENTIYIGSKEIGMDKGYKVAPVPPEREQDFQYLSERKASLESTAAIQQKMRMMCRNNATERAAFEASKQLISDYDNNLQQGAQYNSELHPNHPVRFTQMGYLQKVAQFDEATKALDSKIEIAELEKQARDFDSIYAANNANTHQSAAQSIKSGASIAQAIANASKQASPNSQNNFLSSTLGSQFNDYAALLNTSFTPMPSNYRQPVKPYSKVDPNEFDGDELNVKAKVYALKRQGLHGLSRSEGFVPKSGSNLSKTSLLARTYILDPSGRKQRFGAAVVKDGEADPVDGQFVILGADNKKWLAHDSVASRLSDVAIVGTLHDAIAISKHTEQKGQQDNRLVVCALSEDNLQVVATRFAGLNERGKINIFTSDSQMAQNLAEAGVTADNTQILTAPSGSSWGQLYTATAAKKGFAAAGAEFDDIVSLAEKKAQKFKDEHNARVADEGVNNAPKATPQQLLEAIKNSEEFKKQRDIDLKNAASESNTQDNEDINENPSTPNKPKKPKF